MSKKLKEECYDLDYSFEKWLLKHLKCYLKDAGKAIDLSYHTIEYKGITYTQEEAIKRLIKILKEVRKLNDDPKFWDINVDARIGALRAEMLELWTLVYPFMWW